MRQAFELGLIMEQDVMPNRKESPVAMPPAEPVVTRTVAARLPTEEGEFFLYHYANKRDFKEHLALVLGDVRGGEDVPVRVHSECFTGDVLGSRRCDCGEQLHRAMQMIAAAGRGVIVYLRQEGRGIGLAAKLQAYNLQDEGYDTVEANLLLGHQADEREYWAAAAILGDLSVRSVNLLTNNPSKIEHLRQLGVQVDRRTPVVARIHADNRAYLEAKVLRMRHMLEIPARMDETRATPGPAGQAEFGFQPDVEARLAHLQSQMADHAQLAARPFVTLTYAQSINGAIAGAGNRPLRLSGNESMRLTHVLRSLHDAILVGIGTVLADDPRLTVRLVEGAQPQPVVLDSALRFPLQSRLLDHPRPVLVAAGMAAGEERQAALEAQGAVVLRLPESTPGGIDLDALLAALHARGVRRLMVEGGAHVLRAFLHSRRVDTVAVTLAPRFVAGVDSLPANGPLAAPAPASLPHLTDIRYTTLGADLVVWGRPAWNAGPPG